MKFTPSSLVFILSSATAFTFHPASQIYTRSQEGLFGIAPASERGYPFTHGEWSLPHTDDEFTLPHPDSIKEVAAAYKASKEFGWDSEEAQAAWDLVDKVQVVEKSNEKKGPTTKNNFNARMPHGKWSLPHRPEDFTLPHPDSSKEVADAFKAMRDYGWESEQALAAWDAVDKKAKFAP